MSKKKAKKVTPATAFVLDTNVILHDRDCINKFAEHDVIIPTTLLEELDRFKSGNTEKNYNAREFIRTLDELRIKKVSKTVNGKIKWVSALSNGGASLGEGKGKIEIRSSRYSSQRIKETFPEDIGDHRILGLADEMSTDKRETRKIILITKDVNLRIKADALNIESEDFKNDKVDASDMYLGRAIVDGFSAGEIATIYSDAGEIPTTKLRELYKKPFQPNMYFILRESEQTTALACFNAKTDRLVHVGKNTIAGIKPRNAEQTFCFNALMNPAIQLVTLSGPAGTGKTLLAMAAALEQLKLGIYNQIIIASAIVPVGNKDVGFLPGDLNEKVSPYMQGIFDNLAFIKDQIGKKDARWIESINHEHKEGRIKIQPLVSIRGRSINNTFFVVDETQNTTPHEAKTVITRAGANTKIVFSGDTSQIDSPYLDAYSNGLSHVIAGLTGKELYAHITLEKGERSELATLAAQLL